MSDHEAPEVYRSKPRVKSEALWMASFADLSFTLMAFFALLLSFSSMDKQKFENVRDGMLNRSPKPPAKDAPIVDHKVDNLKQIEQKLISEIKKQKLSAEVVYDSNGVAVEISDRVFFRSGAAEVNNEYRPLTNKLLKILADATNNYQLIFEGHTDDEPLARGSRFASNWELSSARGVAMLNELKKFGVAESRMSVQAYAQTRPKTPIENLNRTDLQNARAKNRRVVIRIY